MHDKCTLLLLFVLFVACVCFCVNETVCVVCACQCGCVSRAHTHVHSGYFHLNRKCPMSQTHIMTKKANRYRPCGTTRRFMQNHVSLLESGE